MKDCTTSTGHTLCIADNGDTAGIWADGDRSVEIPDAEVNAYLSAHGYSVADGASWDGEGGMEIVRVGGVRR